MVFLFSIAAQWFSRGVFLQIFFQQEESLFLTVILLGAFVLSSPIQGHMSDLTSRKKVILLALSAVIASACIILFGSKIPLKFPIVLGIAAVINGVFGNAFPASGAALADRTEEDKQSLHKSFLFRYLGLGAGIFLPFPEIFKLVFSIIFALIALLWVARYVENGKISRVVRGPRI